MATPSLHTSFDASLVEVQHQSFSSTETIASGSASSAKENKRPTEDNAPGRMIRESTTRELYEQWANTYDSDGNFLQAIDDLQLRAVLPTLFESVRGDSSTDSLQVLDFGCGTGRTTRKLLQLDWNGSVSVQAWDGSEGMLKMAKRKCQTFNATGFVKLEFRLIDFLEPENFPRDSIGKIDMFISTLVLEHIPMETYWRGVAKLLSRRGLAFVSNMHPDMGVKSVAGFDDGDGKRVTGKSWLHGVEETVEAAKHAGMEIVGEVLEAKVSEDMITQGLVGERGRKWVGRSVWYGFVARKV